MVERINDTSVFITTSSGQRAVLITTNISDIEPRETAWAAGPEFNVVITMINGKVYEIKAGSTMEDAEVIIHQILGDSSGNVA